MGHSNRSQNLVRTSPHYINRSQNMVRTSPRVLISSGGPALGRDAGNIDVVLVPVKTWWRA